MKKIIILFFIVLLGQRCAAQQKTIQERLGYPKETKLLIIHADDIGVSHSENTASVFTMEKGVVNSGSIMVPCPWFPEIAAYFVAHPESDLGLHLTLTSEWKYYKWGPVASRSKVPSLLDAQGFLNEGLQALMKNGKAEEVEIELRAQIEKAIQFGIKPTHFDAHMGGAVSTQEFFEVLLKLGHEYKVPILIDRAREALFNNNLSILSDKDIVVDKLLIATGEDYKKGMAPYYTSVLKALKPGLTCLLLHAAYDNEEMQAVTEGHIDYGSAWRQADVNFFTSEACKKLLAEEKVRLVTWKEIRDKLIR